MDEELQKHLEISRNTKYQWIACIFSLVIFFANGIVFYWIPRLLRDKRFVKTNRFKSYFAFVDVWQTINTPFAIKLGNKKYYFKPSIAALFACFILLNGKLCYIETDDLDYKPRVFIIGKRCARIALGQMPAMFLSVTKGDFITAITGLTYERAAFLHAWFAILMFLMMTAHVGIIGFYWAHPNFDIAPKYPKYVYGIIGYACFVFLVFGNVALIRRYAFDFFMVNHRVHSFIMLLMAFLHNDRAKAMVILAIHLLVLDKVFGRIYGIIHSMKSPTKGYSEFEILDDETVRVNIPVKTSKTDPNPWYRLLLFKYGTWLAGLHVYLNVRKIDFFQHHPFAIASLPESGKITLVIKKRNGFTKKLYDTVQTMRDQQIANGIDSDAPEHKRVSNPHIVKLKAAFRGPSLGKFQPLITFDSVAFLAQDYGASFVLPLCLDLLQTIERKEVAKNYLGRPAHPYLKVYWSVKKLNNIYWYEDLIKKLLPFINSGKLTMNVFVQESVEFEATRLVPSNHNTKKLDIVSVTSEPLSITNSEIKFIYEEPMEVSKVIQTHISSMHFPEENGFSSLAIMSCGQDNFGSQVESESQKYRWVEGAPNIYFYNESYET